MFSRSGMRQGPGGGGLTGPVPRDLWILLGIVFFTFSLQFFETTAWISNHLRLTPEVWQRGFLWQIVTFEFIGTGAPDLWFMIGLLILFMFGRDLIVRLGAKEFWKFLILASGCGGLIAVVVQLLIGAFAVLICSLTGCSHTDVEEGTALLPKTSAQGRPNILIVVSDDLGYADVGSYGNAVVQTPNIDRLAKEGLQFNHAFVPASMCSPSRAALYTGLYPHRNGMSFSS